MRNNEVVFEKEIVSVTERNQAKDSELFNKLKKYLPEFISEIPFIDFYISINPFKDKILMMQTKLYSSIKNEIPIVEEVVYVQKEDYSIEENVYVRNTDYTKIIGYSEIRPQTINEIVNFIGKNNSFAKMYNQITSRVLNECALMLDSFESNVIIDFYNVPDLNLTVAGFCSIGVFGREEGNIIGNTNIYLLLKTPNNEFEGINVGEMTFFESSNSSSSYSSVDVSRSFLINSPMFVNFVRKL